MREAARAPDICRPTRKRALGSLLLNAAQRRRRHDLGAWLSTHLLEEILPAVDSPLGGSCRKTGRGDKINLESKTFLTFVKHIGAVTWPNHTQIFPSPLKCYSVSAASSVITATSPHPLVLSLASATDAARSQARSRSAAESFSMISQTECSFRATN